MSELAEHLHVVPRAVTPIVDALEECGYLRRDTLVDLLEQVYEAQPEWATRHGGKRRT